MRSELPIIPSPAPIIMALCPAVLGYFMINSERTEKAKVASYAINEVHNEAQ